MNKEKALTRLNELINEADRLPQYSFHGDNSEFGKWYKDVEIALRHIFSDDKEKHVKDFLNITWGLMVFTTSTPDWEFEKTHNRGLSEAKTLLRSYVDEINQYWYEDDRLEGRTEDRIDSLRNLLQRFHLVARQLRIRHDGRASLEINDEYDVQDLVHGLLKLYFDDIRAEEYTPSYAGGSSRIDFLIEDSKIALEIKKTRPTLKDKQIGEELLIDIQRYRAHPSVKKLICFIYDPEGLIINPSGLGKDLSKTGDQIEAEIIIVPNF